MSRIGFWQLLLDDKISYWERDAINSARDQADIAVGQAEANAYSMGQMSERMTRMSREIIMLRAAVTVLVKTLRDTHVLDPKLLDARLEAALEEATAPPEPQAAVDAGQPAPIRPITCIRCRESKVPSATTMTGDGPICDSCIARP